MHTSFSRIFYVLGAMIGIVTIMYFAKSILVPICFALLFACILYPVVKWFVRKGLNKTLGIFITMGGGLILTLGILVLFSAQIIDMAGQYSNFMQKLKSTLETSVAFLNDKVKLIPDIKTQDVIDHLSSLFSDSSFLIISDTVSVTGSFLSFFVLTGIYTFLILFYSEHLTEALLRFVSKTNRESLLKMLREVQQVGKQYFTGMLLLIVALGVLNTIGLLLLGIDYPFFFGFLAALLAIIPYVGTTLGGLIPTLYAFVTYDSYWYPLGVIAIFWFIQFVEGNFLSPKIVGGNMQINALFSILSLIAGGYLWGIAGMILFLPLVAMFKVVCSHFEELKPVASLIGDRIMEEQQIKEPSFIKNLVSKIKKIG